MLLQTQHTTLWQHPQSPQSPAHGTGDTSVPRYPVNKGASPRKSDAQSDCLLQMQALPAAAWHEAHIDKFTQLRPGRTTQKGLLHTEGCHSPRHSRTKQSSTPAGEQTGRPSKTRAHQGRAHLAQGSQRILRASTLAMAPQSDSTPTLSPAKHEHARRSPSSGPTCRCKIYIHAKAP